MTKTEIDTLIASGKVTVKRIPQGKRALNFTAFDWMRIATGESFLDVLRDATATS